MAADGEIIIKTKIDTEGAEDGADKLSSKMREFGDSVDSASGKTGKLGSAIKSGLAAAGKAALAALGTAAAAVSKIVTDSIKGYADFEQLVGGVETLFKTSAATVQQYAADAYKTAGLSANQYMETVTSFSASLLQSLGGDTEAAAKVAGMAITDMADNANKMGSDMASIQTAYQGFAKQNYTMLDNLKLGYGGTKEEMERLLADAEKLTGVHYDISNLNDVYEAIHVVQTELGITGTTAKEASTTIQGSAAMMKAAWQNMLVGMSDENANFDKLIGDLVESVGTFADNILPRIQVALSGVGKLVENLAPIIGAALPKLVQDVLPSLLSAALSLVNSFIVALPELVGTITDVLPTIINDGLLVALPNIATAAVQIVVALATGLADSAPQLIPAIVDAVLLMVQTLIENVPLLVDAAMKLTVGLAQGLIAAIPVLVTKIPEIVVAICAALVDSLPLIAKAGLELIKALGQAMYNAAPDSLKGLIDSIGNAFKQAWEAVKVVWDVVKPFFQAIWEGIRTVFSVAKEILGAYFKSAWEVIKGIWSVVTSFFKSIWDTIAGIFSVVKSVLSGDFQGAWNAIKGIVSTWAGFFRGVWDTIRSVFSNVASYFGTAFKNAFTAIKNALSSVGSYFSQLKNNIVSVFKNIGSTFKSIGQNIVSGIKNGVSAGWTALKNFVADKARSLLNAAKSALGIASPSRKFRDIIGKNIPAGISVGIKANEAEAIAAMSKLTRDMELSASPMVKLAPAMATGAVLPAAVSYAIARTAPTAESAASARTAPGGGNTYNVSATANGRNIFSLIIDEGKRMRAETGRNPFDLN